MHNLFHIGAHLGMVENDARYKKFSRCESYFAGARHTIFMEHSYSVVSGSNWNNYIKYYGRILVGDRIDEEIDSAALTAQIHLMGDSCEINFRGAHHGYLFLSDIITADGLVIPEYNLRAFLNSQNSTYILIDLA